MRLTGIAALLLLSACADFPDLGTKMSEESLAADYPKLVALSQDNLDDNSNTGQEIIDELENRTSSLWARLGLLRN